MNKQNYKWVVYFIGITIITTIAVQVYWNYREYQINKQHLISKVQLSLDNSVEAYFANLTKSGIITFNSKNAESKTDTIVVSTNSRRNFRKKIDSTLQYLAKNDSLGKPIVIKNSRNTSYPFFTANKNIPKNLDSLISKVVVSISKDTLDLEKLNSYLTTEFERNNIDVTFGLQHEYRSRNKQDGVIYKTFNIDNLPKKHLIAVSKSTFLHRSKLEIHFSNETKTLLKASFISVLLSLLLSLSIIASLVYLLKTIYKQKQLAEVKNDLINNITHEFKTPIATISIALEALKNFNALNDPKKSETYISMANTQVNKLNEMVEKILETAALNQETLVISKQPVDLALLLESVIAKYKMIAPEKTLNFKTNKEFLDANLDKFHFENAIGNIIDNAIKYGGKTIFIEMVSEKNTTTILIKDNGKGIPKSEKDSVFKQFYRIPTGNTHNVKGFGIGLYYTKSIIEKHGGSILITYDKNHHTVFKIELPNA
ncbi:sensor histidine kinase [Lutibacter holmesii]|uniref:histidine kinase n=1 Tax=Lutibacter holmesii TaxID=1137985 RepID=A0ABW3WU00_9FLAO